ncbi:MAG TPA: efflux transporter outer membrane subunit [Oceanipulchritudo sp.]|nr:efflux transporter outer membrane subunit [Oceanipulchritudo sp.]
MKRNQFYWISGLLLAGCAVTPPPSAEEALEQALPETTQVREQFAADQSRPIGALPANWIESFQDPQLNAIIDEALANNLNLRAAASLVEASSGLVTQVSAQMKPVVAAAGQGTEQGFEGGMRSSPSQASLNVSWELDIWGRVRAETAAAESEFQAMTAEYEFARLSLKAQVAKAWFTAVEIRKQLEYAQEVVDLYRKTLEITEIKYEYGDADMKNVHLARADLGTAQERLRQVEGADKIARRSLEILVGRYPSAEMEIATEFVAVPPPIPVGLPSELLERRPDLVAAERRVAAAFNMTFAAKAARLPTIGLSAGAGVANNELASLLGAGDAFWNVGANFLAPLYAGGALQTQVEIRTSQQEAALSQYGQRALVAFGEVENALSNETLLAQREELLRAIVQDNRSAVELAQTQYENGLVELLSVLQMQARLVNSQIALISIRNSRLAERINLHLAIGGDFNSN